MGISGSKEPEWKRAPANPIPADPNDAMVNEIHKAFPYGPEQFGVRSMIRLTVHVVLEMKKRGLI